MFGKCLHSHILPSLPPVSFFHTAFPPDKGIKMQILIMNLSSADKLNLFATRKIKILKVLFDYRLCLVQKFPSNPYQFALKLLPTFWGYIIDTEYIQFIFNIISLSPYILYLFTLYSSVFCAHFIIVFLLRILYVLKMSPTNCCYLQCRYRSSRPGKSV